MSTQTTQRLTPDETGIARAIDIWRNGGLVAFPTETVYGLGADASRDKAVRRIYDAKGRPSVNPLIIHVSDITTAQRYARFNDKAARLAEAFWPGPLSLILPLVETAQLSARVSAGLPSVAVRVPQTDLGLRLLRGFGGAIAAPSANPSGQISPTSAAHVLAGLDGRIDAVIDGGLCPVGLESTIVDLSGPNPAILRPGGVPIEALENALKTSLAIRSDDPARPTSPGQMTSHYAPSVPMTLDVSAPSSGALWLGFGPGCTGAELNLSNSGDLIEAAAKLFAALHQLSALATARGIGRIEVAPIPQQGVGAAINDRLTRAAAPR